MCAYWDVSVFSLASQQQCFFLSLSSNTAVTETLPVTSLICLKFNKPRALIALSFPQF